MILGFKGKEARLIWQGEVSRRLPIEIQEVARRKLRLLNAAKTLLDLRIPPANRLEALRGERKGQFSICFRFASGNATDVEIIDYH
jgi:proteic killer suppression protein